MKSLLKYQETMDTILEEIETIKAIYCGEGEFEMHKASE